jgi:phytoene desaturase (3,4-didehydrolycopene-forming)
VWRDGYRFDTGPSLLLFPDEYRKTFKWLGSSLEQHVQLAKIEPAAYRVFFADGYSSSSSRGSGSSGSSSSSGISSSNGSSSSSSSHSYLDLLYDVNDMVQQLEHLQQGAGGRQPPSTCPWNDTPRSTLLACFLLTLLQKAHVCSMQRCVQHSL